MEVVVNRFVFGLVVECERKRGVKDDFKVYGLRNWKDEVVFFEMRKDCR